MKITDITLVMTCCACPEQYDAVDKDKRVIGYLRLRNGYFSVRCPDPSGTVVFESRVDGDGLFDPDEREQYLRLAKTAITRYYNMGSRMFDIGEV